MDYYHVRNGTQLKVRVGSTQLCAARSVLEVPEELTKEFADVYAKSVGLQRLLSLVTAEEADGIRRAATSAASPIVTRATTSMAEMARTASEKETQAAMLAATGVSKTALGTPAAAPASLTEAVPGATAADSAAALVGALAAAAKTTKAK